MKIQIFSLLSNEIICILTAEQWEYLYFHSCENTAISPLIIIPRKSTVFVTVDEYYVIITSEYGGNENNHIITSDNTL